MGEKGNVPVDAAAASLASRATGTAEDLAGVAATKSIELGVEGAAGAIRRDDEADDAPPDAEPTTTS